MKTLISLILQKNFKKLLRILRVVTVAITGNDVPHLQNEDFFYLLNRNQYLVGNLFQIIKVNLS